MFGPLNILTRSTTSSSTPTLRGTLSLTKKPRRTPSKSLMPGRKGWIQCLLSVSKRAEWASCWKRNHRSWPRKSPRSSMNHMRAWRDSEAHQERPCQSLNQHLSTRARSNHRLKQPSLLSPRLNPPETRTKSSQLSFKSTINPWMTETDADFILSLSYYRYHYPNLNPTWP